MSIIALVILAITAVTGQEPTFSPRIFGGALTSIDKYPHAASLYYRRRFICGSFIINERHLLSAAHCFSPKRLRPTRWAARVGSSHLSRGGTLVTFERITCHPDYVRIMSLDHDIAVLHASERIKFIANRVQPATIAGSSYKLEDKQPVSAVGWGLTEHGRTSSLRHVRLQIVNQNICRSLWPRLVTGNMVCTMWPIRGRGQCSGDSGSPVYHNRVVIGVTSWGPRRCGSNTRPTVNVRVSRYINWITGLAGNVSMSN